MRIKIWDSTLVDDLGTIEDTTSAAEREGLNSFKELQFQTFLTPTTSTLIADGNIAEVNGDYYDLAYYQKDQAENGELNVSAEFEHVSYRLNDTVYDMEYFTSTGTPTAVLTVLLAGTGFTVGTVEFSEAVTYSIQEKSSRRKMLMEFVSLLGGEVDFDKFEISILAQRGSATPKNITEGRNFTVIAVSFNARQRDATGNPLVAYSCKLINPMEINLGDVVTMQYGTLGIDTSLRVVSITKNPYNSHDIEFEIGNFNPTLENDIYRIETSAVIKDKLYNGTRIGPEYGFEAVRNDRKARAYLNSTNLALQSGDGLGSWVNKLYYDFDSETGNAELYFDGKLTVQAIEAIKADIDIVISNTIIVQNLYSEYGRIANLTVSELDTSWKKITNYLASNTADVYYTHDYEQYKTWVVAETDGLATEQLQDKDGDLLYWVDETHTGMTKTVNAFPVTIYVYEETIKAEMSFREVDGFIRPRIIMGAGYGIPGYPERGKFVIDKNTDGGLLEYVTADGTKYSIEIGENGILQNGVELLSAIDFYTNGFTAEYSGTIVGYRWTKDVDGKITELENIHTSEIVPVTWGGGVL
jgi:hypothetical protein